ncbi:site-specific DNA-methyltransferase [Limnohabitans sp. DCL3]|uniref:site-specific DNA-methyltransferase n=1 Tax=Limnohabitans sp. DCL3 TaxID=3374103 RepID=UPI003A86FD77
MTITHPLQSIQTPDLMHERLARLKTEFPDLFTNEGQLNPAELLRLTGQAGREHFDFQWWGKSAAKRKAFSPTTAALRYDAARSVNPEIAGGNAIIEGENLEVLKLLLCAYRGQVKCIYIDPPYNTGNDFVYKDNFKEGERAYWERTGVSEGGVKTSTNTRADGRFHSHWLNMIYPRLLVARQLLREDGVIFVSIDDNEVTHLRKVMDEVFGEGNFVACIVWEKTRKNDARFFSIGHEYMLLYAKDLEHLKVLGVLWRDVKPGAPEIIAEWRAIKSRVGETNYEAQQVELRTWYQQLPKTHPSKKLSRYKSVDKWGPWRDDNLSWPGEDGENYEELIHPVTKQPCKIPEGGWRYDPKEMQRRIDAALIEFRKDHNDPPVRKTHLLPIPEEADGLDEGAADADGESAQPAMKVLGSYLYRQAQVSVKRLKALLGSKAFNNPKDHEILSQYIRYVMADDQSGIVLDFFGGSGSTAHAVLEMNKTDKGKRKFVLVQIPETTEVKSIASKNGFKKISDITIERVKRVIQGYGDNPQPIDAGFKVFTLQKSAFPRADFSPDPDATEADQLAALKAFIAAKEASLFNTLDPQAVRDEVLLKCGFQLDVQLTPIAEVTANPLYRARDQQTPPREAIVCFDSHLDTTTLEWLRQQKGHRVIVLEAALDTTGKWNLHHQLGDGLVVF